MRADSGAHHGCRRVVHLVFQLLHRGCQSHRAGHAQSLELIRAASCGTSQPWDPAEGAAHRPDNICGTSY